MFYLDVVGQEFMQFGNNLDKRTSRGLLSGIQE